MLDKFYIEENSSNLILSSVYKDSYPRQKKKKRKEGKLRSLIEHREFCEPCNDDYLIIQSRQRSKNSFPI